MSSAHFSLLPEEEEERDGITGAMATPPALCTSAMADPAPPPPPPPPPHDWELLSMSMSMSMSSSVVAPAASSLPEEIPSADGPPPPPQSCLDWREPLPLSSDGFCHARFEEEESVHWSTVGSTELGTQPVVSDRSAFYCSKELRMQGESAFSVDFSDLAKGRDVIAKDDISVEVLGAIAVDERESAEFISRKIAGGAEEEGGEGGGGEDVCISHVLGPVQLQDVPKNGTVGSATGDGIPNVKAFPDDGRTRKCGRNDRATSASCKRRAERRSSIIWSLAIAAGLVGIAVIGHQWQQERLQGQQLRLELLAKDQKLGDVMLQFDQLKDVISGHHKVLSTSTSLFA